MEIICKEHNTKIDDQDYPCSMCGCGAYDFSEKKPENCGECDWVGCCHPECPFR